MAVLPTQTVVGLIVYAGTNLLLLVLYIALRHYLKTRYLPSAALPTNEPASLYQPPAAAAPEDAGSLGAQPASSSNLSIGDEAHTTIASNSDDLTTTLIADASTTGAFPYNRILHLTTVLVYAILSIMFAYACIAGEWTEWWNHTGPVHGGSLQYTELDIVKWDGSKWYLGLLIDTIRASDAPWQDAQTYGWLIVVISGIILFVHNTLTVCVGGWGTSYSIRYVYRHEWSADEAISNAKPLCDEWMIRCFLQLPSGTALAVLNTSLLQYLAEPVHRNKFVISWILALVCASVSLVLTPIVLTRMNNTYDAAYFDMLYFTPYTSRATSVLERVSLLSTHSSTAVASAADAADSGKQLAELNSIAQMRRDNLLTDEEFIKLKQRIIGSQGT